jgi:hypothetical protein
MRARLLIAMLTVAFAQLSHAQEGNWRQSHHADSVRSVHVYGELGVSASNRTIAIWKRQTGELVAAHAMKGRDVCGAWFVNNGREIAVYIGQTCDTCYGMILLLSATNFAVVDSLGPLFTWSPGSGYLNVEQPYAAISDGIDRLRLSFSMKVMINGHLIELWPMEYECDLRTRTVEKQVKRPDDIGGPLRYESRDRVVTHYLPYSYATEAGVEASVSPSGVFLFDGVTLRERSSFVPQRNGLQRLYRIVRYGPDDAHVVGLQPMQTRDGAVTYTYCVLNIVKDSIEFMVDSLLAVDQIFWAEPTCRQLFAGSSGGEVRSWSVPSSAVDTAMQCDLDMPLRVVADSLYFLSAVALPDSTTIQIGIDPGDGRNVSSSTHMSWRNPGTVSVRVVATRATGVSVLAEREVDVQSGTTATAATYSLRTQAGITSIDVGDDGRILVGTRDGIAVILDDELHVLRARKSFNNGFGATWTSPSSYTLLSSQTSNQNDRGQISTAHQTICRAIDLDAQPELIGHSARSFGGYTWTEPGEDSMQQIFENSHSTDVWFSSHWYPVKKPYEGGASGQVQLDGFRDTTYFTESYRILDGAPPGYVQYSVISACWLEGGKRIAAHLGSRSPSGSSYRYVLIDEQDTVVRAMLYGPKTTGFTAIGPQHIVIDTQWIRLDTFDFAQRHQFQGPFAEDAVPDHAIAWKDGWFYSFHPNGRIHDSVQADTMRPTVIRVFKDGRIIAGYASGLVAIYGDGKRDITSVASEIHDTQTALSCWPSPTTSELSYALPPSMTLPATMEIYDLQGRLCGSTTLAGHHGMVDLTSIMHMEATGVFIVRAHAGSVVAFAKIVVVK